MSATAETAKTAIEVYQPVIVGLGVVALTFVANTLLEFWKSYLAQRKEEDSIRRGLLFEVCNIIEWGESALGVLEDPETTRCAFYRSAFIRDFGPERAGKLSSTEVGLIARISVFQEAVFNLENAKGENWPSSNMWSFEIDEDFRSSSHDLFEKFIDASKLCRSELEKKLKVRR